MKLNSKPFLAPEPLFTDLNTSAGAVLPFPYEGGVSYGLGTGLAPDAVLDASAYVEFYDEMLDAEPFRLGISTLEAPPVPKDPVKMIQTLRKAASGLLSMDKFTVVLGGDHSISQGFYMALTDKYGPVSVIQLDAHADLRESYENSRYSHASVMSRLREITHHTLQIGIRALSVEEADLIKRESIQICTMHAFRSGQFDLESALARLPDPVFVTLDVDVLDWSVIWSTGTPEPGGMNWDEMLRLLEKIFSKKQVVGADLVELSFDGKDRNSPFAAARLMYKMFGFQFHASLRRLNRLWPEKPAGPLRQ
ncbi:agmatinase [bacterium]|nr:agmatinase [bacterium]